MIINLLLPLLVSSAVLAAPLAATFVSRECTTHKGHAANTTNEQPGCSGDTPSALNARIFRTIAGPYTTPEPTTYARHGGIERRLNRTIRLSEERATPGIEKPAPTPTGTAIPTTHTKAKIRTRTKTTRTSAPVKGRSFLPIEDVPIYTIKQTPTTKVRIGIRETSVIVPIERRLIRPGDDKLTATPTPTTHTKTKTRIKTTRTIVRVEERSFQPIEDVPTFTIKPKPTKTKEKVGTPTLVLIEEDTT